ncbi:subtilase-type proteinase Rrt12p [Trichomonascus vanleenenianus]|uniref:S8 family peptidase n=1 Tax=Trichomonascus vanleenenianus TaxID=2268995 RepID=UPI003EC98205
MKLATLLFVLICGVGANILVQLSDNTTLRRFLNAHPQVSNRVSKTFSIGSFQGFCGNFEPGLIRLLQNSLYVAAISPDIRVQVDDIQEEAPRHLARISRRDRLPEDETGSYHYAKDGQEEIDIYVIDTGIHADHPEFEGRVVRGADFTGEGQGDKNGHGTHVAGIIGSKTFGAAKGVKLIEIKVLTGMGLGNLSAVIAGIDFAVNQKRDSGRKALANLSLGAGFNSLLNSAVNAAVDSGLTMIVAAGNANTAACASSPASAGRALTVGAIDDRYDTVASFSNWGSCVDLFASGVYVTSLSHSGDGTLALSGTSMAAPVVTGTIAMYMGLGLSEDEARDKVLSLATRDAIEFKSVFFRPRTPNLIAYNGMADDDTTLTTETATETFTKKNTRRTKRRRKSWHNRVLGH